MPSFARAWATAFLLTQLVEIPLYVWLLRASAPRAFGASALTHPLIWLLSRYVPGSYWLRFALLELFAWHAEALYLAGPSRYGRALWVALLANAASATLGQLSHVLTRLP